MTDEKNVDEKVDERNVRVENFLKDYEALCNKHLIIVNGCGCCDSPFLSYVEDSPEGCVTRIERHLRHLGSAGVPNEHS